MDASFFERDSVTVARDLIGKIFVVRDAKARKIYRTRIVETEAYRTDDRASHCSRGRTERCAPMFEDPGHAYVYFIYGMYEMLNFVTEPEGIPGAVLIRALEPISGFLPARDQKSKDEKSKDKKAKGEQKLNGPGKLCRELGITRADNRRSLLKGRFRVEDDGVKPELIWITPRVGIKEEKPYKPWRFIWADHPSVSKTKENKVILDEFSPE